MQAVMAFVSADFVRLIQQSDPTIGQRASGQEHSRRLFVLHLAVLR